MQSKTDDCATTWRLLRLCLGIFAFTAVVVVLCVLVAVVHVFAAPPPREAGYESTVSAWYRSLMQPDKPWQSCCGEADAFEADTFEVEGDHYVAIITNGKGVLPNGTRIPVPNHKMKWDAGNPTGHGIIFLSNPTTIGAPPAPGYTYVLRNGNQ